MAKAKKQVKKSSGAKSSVPVVPLSDRVVVKLQSADEVVTASGIIIPDTNKDAAHHGVVVAVGPGKWNEDGDARIPCSVRTGDRVVFPQIKAEKILVEGIEYYVIEESRILAVITK